MKDKVKGLRIVDKLKTLLKRRSPESKEVVQSVKNWYTERYETTVIQRNILFLIMVISIITIAFSVLLIRYVKNSRSIEPFVIEIEQKTGVPTVVEPLSIDAYSAEEAIVRYFVMKYIRAREEFVFSTYNLNYNTVVRVLSSDDVYYGDYRPKFGINNPNSPYNLLGQNNNRVVNLKSIIFPTKNTAQVRVSLENKGANSQTSDKICFLEFRFENIQMNEEERLINPLGFKVTLYRIEDERGGIQ